MRQLGVVPFGIAVWGLLCWFLDYFDWRTLVNVYRFVCSIFCIAAQIEIEKLSKNRRACDAEFNRRNKICLQQPVLGAITLDMVAVLFWWSYSLHF
jgi:hypothetical protein